MASSRGTTAYGAIMLALTLVIMAAIVGLLVLMVYLCTNIAYKFIPDKAKKNVKRMFTRKKDGAAAAEDEPGGIKRGRSVVEAGLGQRRCRRAGCRARRGVIGPIGISKTGEGLRRRRLGLGLVA